MSEVIYQARGRVLHQISKHRELSGSKKRGGAEFFVFRFSLFFLTNFEVFGNRMKNSLKCLI